MCWPFGKQGLISGTKMKTAFSLYDIVEFRQMIEMQSFFNFVPGASEWNLDNAFSLSWVCSSFCSSGMSAACSEEIVQVKFLNRNFNKTHFYCQRFMKQGVLFDLILLCCKCYGNAMLLHMEWWWVRSAI